MWRDKTFTKHERERKFKNHTRIEGGMFTNCKSMKGGKVYETNVWRERRVYST
jgi:hypothetical protein